MKKKLFQNYEYEFEKNEKKVLSNFTKQALKQFTGNDQSVKEERIFTSVVNKLESTDEKIKFTKEEKTNLTFQLNNNLKHLQEKTDKASFFTRWFYKNMLNQYSNILDIFNN